MALTGTALRRAAAVWRARPASVVLAAITLLAAASVGLLPRLAGASPSLPIQRIHPGHARVATTGVPDGIAVYRPSTNTFYFRNTPTSGVSDSYLVYGISGDLPVVGNWAGDGIVRPAVYRPSTGYWYVQTLNGSHQPVTQVFNYPTYSSGFAPVAGDWNGTGHDGIGVFFPEGSITIWYLANNLPSGLYAEPDCDIEFGQAGDIPVVGDWMGLGHDGIGVYRPSTGQFYLINTITIQDCEIYLPKVADEIVTYGQPGDIPFAGDWTGSGKDGLGVYRPSNGTMYFRNDATTSGFADNYAVYGLNGDIPLAGHWG